MKHFMVTATIKNRRKYFYIQAKDMSHAVWIFNESLPSIKLRSIKELEKL